MADDQIRAFGRASINKVKLLDWGKFVKNSQPIRIFTTVDFPEIGQQI